LTIFHILTKLGLLTVSRLTDLKGLDWIQNQQRSG